MKTEIYETLITPYYDAMDRDLPWNVYPRPQLKRDSFICLNGEWDFKITGKDGNTSYSGKILVPFPPESKLSCVEKRINTGDTLIYTRTFTIPNEFTRDRTL